MESISHFALSDLKPAQTISGWEEFLSHGEGYLKTAATAYRNGNKIFTSEILYNLIAMAIEKFVMAALMRHGKLPYNHTMTDLVEAIEETFPGAVEGVRQRLLDLDKYQDICDPYEFRITPPEMAEIPDMLELAFTMQTLTSPPAGT